MRTIAHIALVFLIVLCGCTKKENASTVAPFLKADNTQLNISQKPGSATIKIDASISWKIDMSTVPAWMTVYPLTGEAGETSVEINYLANDSTHARMTVIVINSQQGQSIDPLKIEISQMGSAPYLSVNKTNFQEDSTGQKDSIIITSNVPWAINNMPSWMSSADVLNGDAGIHKIHLVIQPNNTVQTRLTTLQVNGAGYPSLTSNLIFNQNINYHIESFYPANGVANESISITGSFGSNPMVTVGGQPVSGTTSPDPQHINFIIPAGIHTGKIIVKFGSTTLTSAQDLVIGNNMVVKATVSGWPASFLCSNGISFVYHNKIYFGLGYDTLRKIYNTSFAIFDPATDGWSAGPSIPPGMLPRKYAECFVLNDIVYIGMGTSNNETDWWSYDATQAGDAAWKQITSYINSGYGGVSYVANNKAYFGEPFWDHTLKSFDPAGDNGLGSWNTVNTQMPALNYCSFFVINSFGYMVAGLSRQSGIVSRVNQIDLSGQTITAKNNAPFATINAAGFALNSFGYVAVNGTLYEYDPLQDQWINKQVNLAGNFERYNATAIDHVGYMWLADGTMYRYYQ